MKFRNFGKTLLIAALSAGVLFSFTSCTQSFTVGFLYVTGLNTNGTGPQGEGVISGFKIDNNTGKLTSIHLLPVSSGGANPSRAVLLRTGNFLYVLNQGVTSSGGTNCSAQDPCFGGNISEFTIGGGGVLTFQNSYTTQGISPFRMVTDPTGNYLYVLEYLSPNTSDAATACQQVTGGTSCGDITAFSINPSTGRLSLIQNAQLTAASNNNTHLTYFPVPQNPVDFAITNSTIFTLAYPQIGAGNANVYYPYVYGAGGQLTESTFSVGTNVLTNGNGVPMGSVNPDEHATAIVQAGNYIYVLDNEPRNGTSSLSQILPYQATGSALTSLVGGVVANAPTLSNPYSLLQDAKGKYVYVINQGSNGVINDPASGISSYVIDPSSHQLTPTHPPTSGSGSGPQCILEDPSDQYIYTADFSSSTVSGYFLDPNTGLLTNLRGSNTPTTFPLPGPGTWCVVTGHTN